VIEAAGQKAADEFNYTLTDADKATIRSQIMDRGTPASQMTDDELRMALNDAEQARKEFLDANRNVPRDTYREAYGQALNEASKTMDTDKAVEVAKAAGEKARAKAAQEIQDQAKAISQKAYQKTEESLLTKRAEQKLLDLYKNEAVEKAQDAVKTKLKDQMADELAAKVAKSLADDAGEGGGARPIPSWSRPRRSSSRMRIRS
jgi:hypothetical protein